MVPLGCLVPLSYKQHEYRCVDANKKTALLAQEAKGCQNWLRSVQSQVAEPETSRSNLQSQSKFHPLKPQTYTSTCHDPISINSDFLILWSDRARLFVRMKMGS